MYIVSSSGSSKKISLIFGTIIMMGIYSILNNIAYGAEFGTYILSELRTNKSINIIENVTQEDASKKCVDDKRDNPGKTLECIWRVDKDYTKPNLTPISPVIPVAPISPVIPVVIIPPTLSVDKSEVNAGDTVTFTWDTKGGTGCYTTVDGKRSVYLSGRSGTIPVEDASPGGYAIGLNCPYGDIVKSAPIIIVTVKARIAPTLSLKATLSNGTTKEYVASNSVVNQITTLDEKIALTWNSSGATTCLFANKEIPKNGSGAFTVVSANTYTYSCYNGPKPTKEADNGNVSNTSVIHFTILPPDTILPTISVNKSKPTVGDSIIFSWDSKGGKNCYSSVDGTKSLIQESKDGATTGKITVDDVGFGKYIIGLSCLYGSNERSANNIVVDVQNPTPPTLSIINNPNPTAGDTVTFGWNGNGGKNCYSTNIGIKNTDLNGTGGTIRATNVPAGDYKLGVACLYGSTPISSSIITISVKAALVIVPPTIIIPPTLSVDKSEVNAGDTVTFTWDTKGGTGCYTTVDGKRSVNLSGTSGVIPVEDVSEGTYAIGLSCPYGDIVKSAPIVVVTVKSAPVVPIIPPTLETNKNIITEGEVITLKWNTNGATDCYISIDDRKGLNINSSSGSVEIKDTFAGIYKIGISCPYDNSIQSSVPLTVEVKSSPKTSFGILYTTLHCPMISNNGLGIQYSYNDSLVWNERPQAFYFWGKPALGHYCLNNAEGESVLRKHAELLKNAGIDYIVIDSTNHAWTNTIGKESSDRSQEMIIEPTKKLLRVWNTIPGAPKVVIWAPIVERGDVYKILLSELDKYPNLKFIFKGKPLVLNTVDTARFTSDTNAIAQLSQTMTVRDMWGMQKERAGNNWQFIQPTGMQGPYNNEQITVTPGYQDTYMTNSSTATPKRRGQTFKNQFQAVFNNPGVDTVIISSWNEWGSIRLQNVFDQSKAAYTDTYDVEHNRDIEPEDGGAGTLYYDLMKDCISAYRLGETTCGR